MSLYSIWPTGGRAKTKIKPKNFTINALDKKILEVYQGQSPAELAEMFDRSPGTISNRLRELVNNGYIDRSIRYAGRPLPWTESEDKYLLNNYHTLGIKEIAKSLKRTEKAVTSRYYKITGEKK